MAGKSKKFYAVFQGHKPGLYSTWTETSEQVNGYKGAVYKSFSIRQDALNWIRERILAASEPVDQSLVELVKELPESPQKGTGSNTGHIVIHTDGGASPNPGVGGYGVVLQHGTLRKELSQGFRLTTNNRMEMLAVIEALRSLKGPSQVILHTDSRYVVDSINKGWVKNWRRKGWKKSNGERPENIDLWEQLLELLEMHVVEFNWVKGHAGDIENERCDTLANEARGMTPLLVDQGYLDSR